MHPLPVDDAGEFLALVRVHGVPHLAAGSCRVQGLGFRVYGLGFRVVENMHWNRDRSVTHLECECFLQTPGSGPSSQRRSSACSQQSPCLADPRAGGVHDGHALLRQQLHLVHTGARGLHSFTSQLNLSAFYGIGGERRGCLARVKGVSEGV